MVGPTVIGSYGGSAVRLSFVTPVRNSLWNAPRKLPVLAHEKPWAADRSLNQLDQGQPTFTGTAGSFGYGHGAGGVGH